MVSVSDIQTEVAELAANIAATDLKLDEVLTFIQSLQAGSPSVVTQEQLNEIFASVRAAKSASGAVLEEADALA